MCVVEVADTVTPEVLLESLRISERCGRVRGLENGLAAYKMLRDSNDPLVRSELARLTESLRRMRDIETVYGKGAATDLSQSFNDALIACGAISDAEVQNARRRESVVTSSVPAV